MQVLPTSTAAKFIQSGLGTWYDLDYSVTGKLIVTVHRRAGYEMIRNVRDKSGFFEKELFNWNSDLYLFSARPFQPFRHLDRESTWGFGNCIQTVLDHDIPALRFVFHLPQNPGIEVENDSFFEFVKKIEDMNTSLEILFRWLDWLSEYHLDSSKQLIYVCTPHRANDIKSLGTIRMCLSDNMSSYVRDKKMSLDVKEAFVAARDVYQRIASLPTFEFDQDLADAIQMIEGGSRFVGSTYPSSVTPEYSLHTIAQKFGYLVWMITFMRQARKAGF